MRTSCRNVCMFTLAKQRTRLFRNASATIPKRFKVNIVCFISDVYNTAALGTEAFMIEVDARQMSDKK